MKESAIFQDKQHSPVFPQPWGKGWKPCILRIWVEERVKESAIETTGAGDAFCGCSIHGLLTHGLEGLTEILVCDLRQERRLSAMKKKARSAGAGKITN